MMMVRFLLVGSFVVFAAGASVPAKDSFWGMSLEEGLRWIAVHPGRWSFTTISFIVSLLLCICGLAALDLSIQESQAKAIARIGFYLFLAGSLTWILGMGVRLGVAPWAARIYVETAALPESFEPLRRLEAVLTDLFMVAAFSASSIYGLALLREPQFPNALGWFALVYGLFGAAAYAVAGLPIPIMALVVPLVLGLSPLPGLKG